MPFLNPSQLIECTTHPIEETLEEPLKGVETSVNVLPIEMLFQLGKEFCKYPIVLLLETKQLREAGNKEAYECIKQMSKMKN